MINALSPRTVGILTLVGSPVHHVPLLVLHCPLRGPDSSDSRKPRDVGTRVIRPTLEVGYPCVPCLESSLAPTLWVSFAFALPPFRSKAVYLSRWL